MCRLLAYLGSPVSLESLLDNHEHSLITQSYQPQEMISGTVNADGFGVGWYHAQKDTEPFSYRSTLPIWNDVNLPSLSRYVESGCVVSYVRSATAGQALDISNCQPFKYQRLLFIHNGKIDQFRQTLYRPIRSLLNDEIYQWVKGTTDSEHIFALLLNELQNSPGKSLEQAMHLTLLKLKELAEHHETYTLANLVISDGNRLVASRFSTKPPSPSLYWLQNDSNSNSVIIASEPLFKGNWNSFPENSILSVREDCDIRIEQI
ncbi:ergothioneine biosynthesis protein EgtC [Rivularia sp. UHCC 0363]|uniref:ergothioneine biosynthesis protein EgtC n=1 Tax=Rivularia sp. UHCC 0363 TaxID=3110244 RepID=UPI002B1EAA9B|nr:ergothioneine biosynthesis protein EgtC [Rivularia sp. UHCC 0363]MEA5596616.1 ergothioneine biosynthesis protein EgtC [Rivularia sp. UHCC 0363]